MSSKEIDLSRGESQATFMYNVGNIESSKSYRVTEGILKLEDFSLTKIKGTFDFKANKIGDPDLTITATNGKLDFKRL